MNIESQIIDLKKEIPVTLSLDLLNLIESKDIINKTFESD